MASVFFSYAHADKALAHRLANLLQEEGLDVWVDFWELTIGDSIIHRIGDALTSVDYVVALVSSSSVGSNWCQKELAISVTQELGGSKVRVLPLRIGDVRMPPALVDKLYLNVDENDLLDCARRLAKDIRRRNRGKPEIQAMREHATHQGTVFDSRITRRQGSIVWITAGEDGMLWLRGLNRADTDRPLVQLPEPIRCISFVRASERPLLACGSTRGRLFLVDYESGEVIQSHKLARGYIWSVEAFMQNGRPRAVCSADDCVLRFRDLNTGAPFLPDKRTTGDTMGPVVLPSGLSREAILFGGLSERYARPPGRGIAYAVDPRDGEAWSELYPADYGPVWAVDAYRHEGNDICVTAGYSAVIHSWDLSYQDQVGETESLGILGITALRALKLEGEPFALSGGGREDGKLRLTRLSDGEIVDSHQAHTDMVQSIDVIPKGSSYYAVTASSDGSAGSFLVA